MGESTLTAYATVGKKCQWVILQTQVYHVFVYLCEVDYMMPNTFMYEALS